MSVLCLGVKDMDVIIIGGQVLVRVERKGRKMRLYFDAPKDVRIDRLAVHERRGRGQEGPPASALGRSPKE